MTCSIKLSSVHPRPRLQHFFISILSWLLFFKYFGTYPGDGKYDVYCMSYHNIFVIFIHNGLQVIGQQSLKDVKTYLNVNLGTLSGLVNTENNSSETKTIFTPMEVDFGTLVDIPSPRPMEVFTPMEVDFGMLLHFNQPPCSKQLTHAVRTRRSKSS